MNPQSTSNMSTRDVPTELTRNAERRQRREALDRALAVWDALAFVTVIAFCILLKTCIR
jgi:hypothetical protein